MFLLDWGPDEADKGPSATLHHVQGSVDGFLFCDEPLVDLKGAAVSLGSVLLDDPVDVSQVLLELQFGLFGLRCQALRDAATEDHGANRDREEKIPLSYSEKRSFLINVSLGLANVEVASLCLLDRRLLCYLF